MISQQELERMKHATVIKSKDEQIQQKKLHDEQKDQQMAAAKVSAADNRSNARRRWLKWTASVRRRSSRQTTRRGSR
jgi:hypothetical protein